MRIATFDLPNCHWQHNSAPRIAIRERFSFSPLLSPLSSPPSRGFSLVELLVVVTIIGVLIALLLPAVQSAREAARRAQSSNRIKQSGLALHNYVHAHDVFPPGCIVSVTDGNPPKYDPWTEASEAGAGRHGTSWMLMLLPYMEQAGVFDGWDFTKNVAGNPIAAQTDISEYYCPSRRKKIRSADKKYLLNSTWTGGGSDYGGCLGGGDGFLNSTASHRFAASTNQAWDKATSIGIFSPNSAVGFIDIKDGASNTIAIGELQDGWALGGAATLFTTARYEINGDYLTLDTPAINNNFFESAGSDHPCGAHFGMADGSVQFFSDSIDKQAYYYLGAMADKQLVQVP